MNISTPYTIPLHDIMRDTTVENASLNMIDESLDKLFKSFENYLNKKNLQQVNEYIQKSNKNNTEKHTILSLLYDIFQSLNHPDQIKTKQILLALHEKIKQVNDMTESQLNISLKPHKKSHLIKKYDLYHYQVFFNDYELFPLNIKLNSEYSSFGEMESNFTLQKFKMKHGVGYYDKNRHTLYIDFQFSLSRNIEYNFKLLNNSTNFSKKDLINLTKETLKDSLTLFNGTYDNSIKPQLFILPLNQQKKFSTKKLLKIKLPENSEFAKKEDIPLIPDIKTESIIYSDTANTEQKNRAHLIANVFKQKDYKNFIKIPRDTSEEKHYDFIPIDFNIHINDDITVSYINKEKTSTQ